MGALKSITKSKFSTTSTTTDVMYLEDELTKVSRPNLLLNSNFAIAQRSYSGGTTTSFTTTKNTKKYCFDRWLMWNAYDCSNNDYQTVNITNKSHTSTETSCQGLAQIIEYPEILSGKTVTFSVNGHVNASTTRLGVVVGVYTGNTNISSSDPSYLNNSGNYFYNSGNTNSTTDTTISTSVVLPTLSNTDKLVFLIWNTGTAGGTIYVNWAKAEIGRTATPYTPPNPGLEMMKCRRFYSNISNAENLPVMLQGMTESSSTTSLRAILPMKNYKQTIMDAIVFSRYRPHQTDYAGVGTNSNYRSNYIASTKTAAQSNVTIGTLTMGVGDGAAKNTLSLIHNSSISSIPNLPSLLFAYFVRIPSDLHQFQ